MKCGSLSSSLSRLRTLSRQAVTKRTQASARGAPLQTCRHNPRLGTPVLQHERHLVCCCSRPDSKSSSLSSATPQVDHDPSAENKVLTAMRTSNSLLPYLVVASAAVSLIWSSSFAWFVPAYFAPALGFLMFAVGLNLKPQAFIIVFKSPQNIAVGAAGQWILKPMLGMLVASAVVPLFQLPPAVGTGLILVSCVSGAQLASYATFLLHPEQAPLSIVLTALSTACGVLITPLLSLLLLGARIPVDALGMMWSIIQIVILPVAAGLLFSTYVPGTVQKLRPFLTLASVIDTCCCVGASLSGNNAAQSSTAGKILLPVALFHAAAFVAGYQLARRTVASDSVSLARTISLQTGMQSSLLALLLATKFFSDPLVQLPCGISVIVMTLSGFGLVLLWQDRDSRSQRAV